MHSGPILLSEPILLGPDQGGQAALIADGLISAVGASTELAELTAPDGLKAGGKGPAGWAQRLFAIRPAGRAAQSDRLALKGGSLKPARINAHTHIYSGLAPLGMPPPEPPPQNFVEILQRVWWRLDRALDAASLRAAARLYCAETLLAGTTTLIDHHESPALIDGSLDILADVAEELGVRLLTCYGATERNDGRQEAQAGLAECRRFIEQNQRPNVRGAVALHASFTVSDDTVREAGELCRQLDAVMHVHMAEDGADVQDARARGYAGPLERLIDLGALPSGSILAHGVHLDVEQVRRAAEAGAWLVQNPRSNANNNVGYAGVLAASERVALGTDGFAANMDDEAGALQQLAQANGDASWRSRIEGATAMAEELFGLSFTLAAGSAADVGLFADDGKPIHLVAGGRLVVRDGALVTGDIEAIRAEARGEAERLWTRMKAL